MNYNSEENPTDMSSFKNSKMKTKVYNIIFKEILNGVFKPGDKILIKDLSKKYGVSTTPIREALSKLNNEGILNKEPYKSYEIKRYPNEEIEKIYQARIIIESQVAKLAAKKFDGSFANKFQEILSKSEQVINNKDYELFNQYNSEFHFTLFKVADNDYLFNMIKNINQHIIVLNHQAFLNASDDYKKSRFSQALNEHKKIYDCLKHNDKSKIAEFIKEHLEASLSRFKNID
ncbi:MAG: GntR family transcriptional regulator [bacterium]